MVFSSSSSKDNNSNVCSRENNNATVIESATKTLFETTTPNIVDNNNNVNDGEHDNGNSNNHNNNKNDIKRFVGHLKLKKGWERYNENDELFVRGLPKIELHVHLDGSFEFDVLWKTLQKRPQLMQCFPVSTNPPWEPSKTLHSRKLVTECETSTDYRTLCTCRGKRSLNEMLNCFEMFLPVVRGNLELLEELAYDFVQRQWEQNVVYTEVRYSPQLFVDEMNTTTTNDNVIITGRTITDVITKGLRRGCYDYDGIIVNQILCGIAWRPDWAMETVDIANERKNDYPCAIVGVDIAAGEEHFNAIEFPEIHTVHHKMIQKAKQLKLNITLHAGETIRKESLQNVSDAITEYGAQRIGHGYRMVRSKQVMDQVKHKNVHVEVCPTSSVETGGWIYNDGNDDENNNTNDNTNNTNDDDDDGSTVGNNNNNSSSTVITKQTATTTTTRTKKKKRDWKKHPCITMLQHNISFSFSSDDPAVFHTSLTWQYRIAIIKMGFTKQQLIQTILNSINAAFCSTKEKDKLRTMIYNFVQNNTNNDIEKNNLLLLFNNNNSIVDNKNDNTDNNNNNNNEITSNTTTNTTTTTSGLKRKFVFRDRVQEPHETQ